MAAKIYHGDYDREDYKNWGKKGGRPRKFKDEAEKKRFYRQQKKGVPLRAYRSYKETTRTTSKQSTVDPDNISGKYNCPACGRPHKVDKSRSGYIEGDYFRFREGLINQDGLITCANCNYRYPIAIKRTQRTIYRAGNSTERKRLERARKDLDSYPFSHPKYKEALAVLESFVVKK